MLAENVKQLGRLANAITVKSVCRGVAMKPESQTSRRVKSSFARRLQDQESRERRNDVRGCEVVSRTRPVDNFYYRYVMKTILTNIKRIIAQQMFISIVFFCGASRNVHNCKSSYGRLCVGSRKMQFLSEGNIKKSFSCAPAVAETETDTAKLLRFSSSRLAFDGRN